MNVDIKICNKILPIYRTEEMAQQLIALLALVEDLDLFPSISGVVQGYL